MNCEIIRPGVRAFKSIFDIIESRPNALEIGVGKIRQR